MKKVAIYCRSDKNDKHRIDIKSQKRETASYCSKEKRPYDIYIDNGFSADNIDRPDLKRLMSKINDYDMVLCTDLSVLSRNILDLKLITKAFKSHGVNLVILHKIIKSA